MKKVLWISICVLYFSCADTTEKKHPPIATSKKTDTVKKDSVSTIIGNIGANDGQCLREIEMAKKEISQNKLVYTIYKFDNVAYGENLDELKTLLAPYNIDCIKMEGIGNCLPTYGRQNCYADFMNASIKNKFKKGFIDSLINVSLRNFLIKDNDEKFYEYIDQFYKLIYYSKAKSFETQEKEIISDFKAWFKYPKGFVSGKEKWHANLHFIINTKGEIKFYTVEVKFDNPNNKKFEALFIKNIKKFIVASKWIPAEIEGIKVNRRVILNINKNSESL